MNFERKAIFLDRDGVVNEDTAYPHKPEHIKFKDGIFKFCKAAIQKGYIIVIVTNQAGVAKGHFSESDVQFLHKWMHNKFQEQGIEISGFYYCPYHKDALIPEYKEDSFFRKPNPGMILKASEELGININKSVIVGDKPSDRIELKELRSIILKSDYTGDDYDVESIGAVENLIG
jgi:D-glycero-D-manno-heptose 1,7-bisphosphate phosphatase